MKDKEKANKKTEDEKFREKVGGRIYQIRTALKMSQRDLAEQADLSQSAIAQFENGDRLPSTTALRGICAVLGISMERLLSESTDVEDQGKEVLLERMVQKARELSKENILTLNRFVEQLPPEKPEKKDKK
jgi:HTH-type transcriptional regulator, repressor for puuD